MSMPDFVEYIIDKYGDQDDHDDKACISCTHRKVMPRSDEHRDNFCDIDGHYIGYCGLWEHTCDNHELERGGRKDD